MFLNPWYSGQQRPAPEKPSSQKSCASPNRSSPIPRAQSQSDNEEDDKATKVLQESPYLSSASRSRRSIQNRIGTGWTVHLSPDGRFYYCNHLTQTSSWLPPSDSWDSVANGVIALPYGWEVAQDKEGRTYYINHINKTTSYDDPRKWDLESELDPEPRSVELVRDSEMGFGFVAGSEKPVIVRFVTSGGPSVKKLLPGDQILQINGEDVKIAPRDHVIQLVRNCKEKVSLIVCQPPLDNSSTRKSAILSAAKKAKLKSNPSRVRFAESVDINGFNDEPPTSDSVVPLMPNVLKVFLENGQTKSFKYDASTTVHDVIESLQVKLGLQSINHFSLVVEHIKSLRRNKLTLLDPKERLAQIASRPGAHNLRCLFRVTFVPSDPGSLLREDPVAFEYLYVQSCNDVVQERFAPELQYDIALRLAALQIHQHVLSTSIPPNGASSSSSSSSVVNNGVISSKMAIKTVEKECGLDRFIPTSLRDTMKRKELRKLLTHFLKLNSSQSNLLLGSSSSVKSSLGGREGHQTAFTALQAKLHYLKIIGELPSYGAKCFSTNISDSNVETVILISPKFGISQINSLRNSVPLNLCDIEQVTSVRISKEDEISRKVDIQLKDPDKENIVLSLEERDAKELVLVLQGYYKLLSHRALEISLESFSEEPSQKKTWEESSASGIEESPAPPYCNKHTVSTGQGWNYPGGHNSMADTKYSLMDFGSHPPYHPPPDSFRITQMNQQNSSDSGSDGDASMASNNTAGGGESNNTTFDRNSNNITRLENYNNSIAVATTTNHSSSPKHLNTFIQNNINNNASLNSNANLNHHRPNGILKKPSRTLSPQTRVVGHSGNFQNTSPIIRGGNQQQQQHNNHHNNINNLNRAPEKRTNETLERLTEMKELVADAEEYLTDTSEHSRHNDSELSPTNYGKLKHSDSLILLAQNIGGEGVKQQLTFNAATEAVNKSVLLLSKSPLKDVLLMSSSNNNSDSEASTPAPSPARFSGPHPPPLPPPVVASRLKTSDSSFGLHSPDNLPLGLNPKEENGVRDLLKKIKISNSKQEDLSSGSNLVLDPDLIDLTMIPPPMTPDEDGVYRVFPGTNNPVSTPPTPFADRQSLEAELKALERESPECSEEGGSWRDSVDARTHSGEESGVDLRGSMTTTRDLDNFIANVTIPPPPSGSKESKDISSFIIPPPPSSPLRPPRPGGSGSEIAPKIASLQKRLAHLTSPERSAPIMSPEKQKKKPVIIIPSQPKAGHVQSQAEFFNGGPREEAGGASTPPPPPPPRASLPSNKTTQAPPCLRNPSSPFKSPVTPSSSSSSSSSIIITTTRSPQEEEEEDAPPSLPPRGTSRSPPPLSPSNPHPRFSPKPALPARARPPALPAKSSSTINRRVVPSPPESSEEDPWETSRALVFRKAEQVVLEVVEHIIESEMLCENANISHPNEEEYNRAKERLTNESRQFVTASKLFVKSATESEGQLLDCLNHCIQMMDRIRYVTREVVQASPTPSGTRELIAKVRNVAETYLATVKAASGHPDDPDMNVLMKRATSLASVLTTLMRSLRVFN